MDIVPQLIGVKMKIDQSWMDLVNRWKAIETEIRVSPEVAQKDAWKYLQELAPLVSVGATFCVERWMAEAPKEEPKPAPKKVVKKVAPKPVQNKKRGRPRKKMG